MKVSEFKVAVIQELNNFKGSSILRCPNFSNKTQTFIQNDIMNEVKFLLLDFNKIIEQDIKMFLEINIRKLQPKKLKHLQSILFMVNFWY